MAYRFTASHGFLFLALVIVVWMLMNTRNDMALKVEQLRSLQKKLLNKVPQDSAAVDNWKTMAVEQMSAEQMFQYLHWTNSSACDVAFDFGGIVLNYFGYKGIDGQKTVCMDHGLAPNQHDCLIYSVGNNNEWSFDDMFQQFGCQVFTFDPSVAANDHDRSAQIHFRKLGLWHEDTDSGPNGWKLRTLDSIYRMLEPVHGAKVIDYLKVDIEGAEFKVLHQMIASGMLERVRQMGVEIHFQLATRSDYVEGIQAMQALERHGMVRFSSRVNIWMNKTIPFLGRNDYFGYEITWYNPKFKL